MPHKTAHAFHEAERFSVCGVCGQIFDVRDATQAAHHGGDDHEPLLAKQDD